MVFCEDKQDVISIPNYQTTFIYFLLKDNEVVYVGQTKQGIARPFSHKDKVFDEIKILYCEKEQLDVWENRFIQKYKPIYNKKSNYVVQWSLLRVRNQIRKITSNKNFFIHDLKKIIAQLDIAITRDFYNSNETITFDDYLKIMAYLGANYERHQ